MEYGTVNTLTLTFWLDVPPKTSAVAPRRRYYATASVGESRDALVARSLLGLMGFILARDRLWQLGHDLLVYHSTSMNMS